MKQLEAHLFRPALRLGRRPIKVYLEGSKQSSYLWSNYSLSRDMPRPVQKRPKVDHFSTPKAERR